MYLTPCCKFFVKRIQLLYYLSVVTIMYSISLLIIVVAIEEVFVTRLVM